MLINSLLENYKDNNVAILRDSQRLIYKNELVDLINKCGFSLLDRGVKSGDAIAISFENSIDYIITLLALQLLQVTTLHLDNRLNENMIKENLRIGGISKHISPVPLKELEGLSTSRQLSPSKNDFIATIALTSGTTGARKKILLSASSEYLAAHHIAANIGNNSSDLELLLMPLSHSFGLGRLRSCLIQNTCCFVGVKPTSVKNILRCFNEFNISGLGLVPAAYRYLERIGGDNILSALSSLKYIEFGSSPFTQREKSKIIESLPHTKIMMHYGLTEVSRALFLNLRTAPLDASGMIGSGAEIKIKPFKENRTDSEKLGKIYARAPWQLTNFSDFDTSSVNVNDRSKLPFVDTGDVGYIQNGYLHVKGRNAFHLNIAGKKVMPEEIEAVLMSHEQVSEVAIIGKKDPIVGEQVVCFIVPRKESVSIDSLKAFASEKLPNFMAPSIYLVLEKLPKSESGKVRKSLLYDIMAAND